MNKDISIKDDDGNNYLIKDIKSFHKHILEYHGSGISIHEENGHYFTVNDKFRNMINDLVNSS